MRRATADRVARWPLVLSVSVPDGECIVVVGIVLSACAALRDKLLATHGTAWNQTRRRAALRRRACWHAGYARAHGRSGSSAPWPPGWLTAVQRSRGGGRAARQPRPSANGSRQLRWGGSHPRADFVFRRAVVPPEKVFRKVACVGVISWRTGPPEYNYILVYILLRYTSTYYEYIRARIQRV